MIFMLGCGFSHVYAEPLTLDYDVRPLRSDVQITNVARMKDGRDDTAASVYYPNPGDAIRFDIVDPPKNVESIYVCLTGRYNVSVYTPDGSWSNGTINNTCGHVQIRHSPVNYIIFVSLDKGTYKIYEMQIYPGMPPPDVTGLKAQSGDTQVYLRWDPSPEPNIRYQIYIDGRMVHETMQTQYTALNLHNDVEYDFCIQAINSSGMTSGKTCVKETPKNPDLIPPPAPYDLVGQGTHQSVRLTWRADPVGDFSHYNVYRDGAYISKVYFTAFTDRDVVNDTSYQYYVTSVDKSGNESDPSNIVDVTPYDDRPPPIPPPDPDDISNEDLRGISKSMFGLFDTAKIGGMLIIGGAIALGVIFVVARWIWRRTRHWVKKSK